MKGNDMHRILKPKNMRRLINLLALIAPIVYLFATQIFALAGAHGEQLFSEPLYLETYVQGDSLIRGDNYIHVAGTSRYAFIYSIFNHEDYYIDVTFLGNHYSHLKSVEYSSTYRSCDLWNSNADYVRLGDWQRVSVDSSWYPTYSYSSWDIYGSYDGLSPIWNSAFDTFNLLDVPTEVVPENNSSYTDYLFGNFFMKNNFLEKFGSDSLNDEYGFKPMNDLLSAVDSVADIGGTQLGRMAYGYLAYCGYVLLLNLVAGVLVFIFTWPDMIMDRLHGGID